MAAPRCSLRVLLLLLLRADRARAACMGSATTTPLSQEYCASGDDGFHISSSVAPGSCWDEHNLADHCIVLSAASINIGDQAFQGACVRDVVVQPDTTFDTVVGSAGPASETFKDTNPASHCGTITTITITFLCDLGSST